MAGQMIKSDRFALTLYPIPGVDPRITRIAAEHSRTGEAATAGILFTGGKDAHDEVQDELVHLAYAFDLPGGHWHRLTEADGVPTYCNEPDPDGEEAWLRFAADHGIPPQQATRTLLDPPTGTSQFTQHVA